MSVRIGAALAVTFASFLTLPATLFACQKCQFVEQGFQCAFASVSCCSVINGSSCESGPCSGGCGSLVLTAEGVLEPVSGVASCEGGQGGPATEPAPSPSGTEGKQARSTILPARR